jgi:hypothetical protein
VEWQPDRARLRVQQRAANAMNADAVVALRDSGEQRDRLDAVILE